MNDVFALKLFTRVARLGSFSSAGRELGIAQPRASRLIAALERDLGTVLLSRTTRAVVLTEAGADYLTRIEPILDALDDANQTVNGTAELRGSIRVGLPTSFAIREIIPRLPGFAAKHPRLRIHLLMEDQRQDLLRQAVDVAFRFGDLPDSVATARLIGANPRLLVAAPAYLARAGMPASPADLARHQTIAGPPALTQDGWTFSRDGQTVIVRIDAAITATNNEGAMAIALAGMGIASTGLWGCRSDLASGALVRVLADWAQPAVPLHAVFPLGRAASRAARALVDHLFGEHGLNS